MRLPRAGTIEIVPSVLAADFGHLAAEVAQVEAGSAIFSLRDRAAAITALQQAAKRENG